MFGRIALVFALASVAACTFGEEEYTDSTENELANPIAQTAPTPRGTYVMLPEGSVLPEPTPIAAGQPRVIYLNKNGGTYSSSNSNNSSTNASTIPNGTSSIPAWNVSASGWNSLVTCVRDTFSRFNVVVTDQDPGAASHVEAVVAGYPQNIGMQSGVGGVSPFSCGMIEKSIVFAFAEVYGNNIQALCETTAQEIAHSYGLDHSYLCSDPMTYLDGCGAKSFQDTNAQCGEYSARACQCGGSTQNTVQLLYARLGTADAIAPTVNIDQPANGSTVQAGFEVAATAADDIGVSQVELWIDGQRVATDTSAPYSFTTPATLGVGNHSVEVRAYDGGNMTADTINVTVEAPPGGGDDPPPGGGDDPPPGGGDDPPPDDPPFNPGELGAGCGDGTECASGICLEGFGESRCTATCDRADATSCPEGFECLGTTGAESVCWPSEPDNGGGGADVGDEDVITGGCSTSGGSGSSLAWIAVIGLALLRRRRRA